MVQVGMVVGPYRKVTGAELVEGSPVLLGQGEDVEFLQV